MSTSLPRGTRLATLAVFLTAALIALPAIASAKTATRIAYAPSTQVVVRDKTVLENPWLTKTVSAKLQKKVNGRWVGLKGGVVKLYRYDTTLDNPAYVYTNVWARSSSSGLVTLRIDRRGKYRLSYAGSTTMKPANAVSTFLEDIGLTVSLADQPGDVTFTQIGTSTTYWVNVIYNVDWNTEAWDPTIAGDGAVSLEMEGAFTDVDQTTEGDWVLYKRDFMSPGPVEFNFKVDEGQVSGSFPYFDTWGDVSVDPVWDPYIVGKSAPESPTRTPVVPVLTTP